MMKSSEGRRRAAPPRSTAPLTGASSGISSVVLSVVVASFVLHVLLTVMVVVEAAIPMVAAGDGDGDGDGDASHYPEREGRSGGGFGFGFVPHHQGGKWRKKRRHRPMISGGPVPSAEEATPPQQPPPPRLRLSLPPPREEGGEGSNLGGRVTSPTQRGGVGGRSLGRRGRRRRRTTMMTDDGARRGVVGVVRNPRRRIWREKRRPRAYYHGRRHDDDVVPRDLETFGSSSSDDTTTTVPGVQAQARIVGGTEIEEFRYPYLAALFKRFSPTYIEHRCGGVLVAPNVILSAAHCHDRADVAKLGEHRFDDNVTAVEEFNITRKFQHPNFDEFLLDYDVGLYVLDSDSAFTPVKMNFDELTPNDGDTLHVLGWGFTRWGGKASPVPNEVGVAYQPNDSCNTRYVNSFDPAKPRITDAMMCAANPGKDACQGDSGGPLLRKGDRTYMSTRRYAVDAAANDTTTTTTTEGGFGGEEEEEDVVVGLVSWGFGCADAKYPGVYARVSSVGEWIVETLCTLGHEVHCVVDDDASGGDDKNTTRKPPPPAEAERAPRSTNSLEP